MTMKRHMAIFGSAIGLSALIAVAVVGVEWSVSPLSAQDLTLGANDQAGQETGDGDFLPPLSGAPHKRVGAGSRQLSAGQPDPCAPKSADGSSGEAAEVVEVAEAECESATTPTE